MVALRGEKVEQSDTYGVRYSDLRRGMNVTRRAVGNIHFPKTNTSPTVHPGRAVLSFPFQAVFPREWGIEMV